MFSPWPAAWLSLACAILGCLYHFLQGPSLISGCPSPRGQQCPVTLSLPCRARSRSCASPAPSHWPGLVRLQARQCPGLGYFCPPCVRAVHTPSAMSPLSLARACLPFIPALPAVVSCHQGQEGQPCSVAHGSPHCCLTPGAACSPVSRPVHCLPIPGSLPTLGVVRKSFLLPWLLSQGPQHALA